MNRPQGQRAKAGPTRTMRTILAGIALLLVGAALSAYRGEPGLLAIWSYIWGVGLIVLGLLLAAIGAWSTRGRLRRQPPDHA